MLADPRNPAYTQALSEPCPVCKAKPGDGCTNPIQPGKPLPGRDLHHGRSEVFDERLRRYTAQEGNHQCSGLGG